MDQKSTGLWLFKRNTSVPLKGVKICKGLVAEWDPELTVGLAIVVPSNEDALNEENTQPSRIHFGGRRNLLKNSNVVFLHSEKSRTDRSIKARCYIRIRPVQSKTTPECEFAMETTENIADNSGGTYSGLPVDIKQPQPPAKRPKLNSTAAPSAKSLSEQLMVVALAAGATATNSEVNLAARALPAWEAPAVQQPASGESTTLAMHCDDLTTKARATSLVTENTPRTSVEPFPSVELMPDHSKGLMEAFDVTAKAIADFKRAAKADPDGRGVRIEHLVELEETIAKSGEVVRLLRLSSSV